MKKTALIIVTMLLCICLLCSCSEKTSIQADTGLEFTTEDFTISDSFENVVPETAGNQILAVKVLADKDADPDLFTNTFFGETNSIASDGNNTYECKAVAYGVNADNAVIVALYEIPSGMQNQKFTISGPFTSFSGTAK